MNNSNENLVTKEELNLGKVQKLVNDYLKEYDEDNFMNFGSDRDENLLSFSDMYKDILDKLNIKYNSIYTSDVSDGKYLTEIELVDGTKLNLDNKAWDDSEDIADNISYVLKSQEKEIVNEGKNINDDVLDTTIDFFKENDLEDLMEYGSDNDIGLYHISDLYKKLLDKANIPYKQITTDEISDGKYQTNIVLNNNKDVSVENSAFDGIRGVAQNLEIITQENNLAKTNEYQDLLNNDDEFKYQFLDRLISDCKYYINNPEISEKTLWTHNIDKQIQLMKDLYNSFSDDKKPEWTSLEEINNFESSMTSIRQEDEEDLEQ